MPTNLSYARMPENDVYHLIDTKSSSTLCGLKVNNALVKWSSSNSEEARSRSFMPTLRRRGGQSFHWTDET